MTNNNILKKFEEYTLKEDVKKNISKIINKFLKIYYPNTILVYTKLYEGIEKYKQVMVWDEIHHRHNTIDVKEIEDGLKLTLIAF